MKAKEKPFKQWKFIKVLFNDIWLNINICFIIDILEINGLVEVFINGEWHKTKLTKKEILILTKY